MHLESVEVRGGRRERGPQERIVVWEEGEENTQKEGDGCESTVSLWAQEELGACLTADDEKRCERDRRHVDQIDVAVLVLRYEAAEAMKAGEIACTPN